MDMSNLTRLTVSWILPSCLFLLATAAPSEPVTEPSRSEIPDSHRLVVDTPDLGYTEYPVRILRRSTAEAMTFDPEHDEPATIRYHLTRDGTIRIRAVWRRDESLVLRTLLDWTHQAFGDHEVRWNGRDASGNVVDNTACRITFEGDDPTHLRHDPAECHEPELELLPPPNGVAVTDLSQIRARIRTGTASGRDDGYSLRCYVDYELVHERRLGADRRSFALPPLPLDRGEHLVTLNLDDGAGHVGVAGVRVVGFSAESGRTAGEEIFRRIGCDSCHELSHARWIEPGPGLQYIGSRRPPAYLRRVILEPRAVSQTAKMSPSDLRADELQYLLEYLVSLRRPPGGARSGSEIYAQEGCADCHDSEGEFGAMGGPELRGVGGRRSRGYLELAVLEPRKIWPRTSMPPTRLSSREFQNLVEFLSERE